jgi:hypothetical protein
MYSNDGSQGGAQDCEAYEAKKKREKLRCLLLLQKKNFFYIYDVITWGK